MFTQFSLSLDSSNYTFKIKLDEVAIKFFKENKEQIKQELEKIEADTIQDEYVGEVMGLAYRDVTDAFMLKELNRWKKFFETNGLNVYEPKVVALKNRLKDLEEISDREKELLLELED